MEDERLDPLRTQSQKALVPRAAGGANPNGHRYLHGSSVTTAK
jgi:hypothetical protein